MRKRNRKWAVLLVAAMTVQLLAGCGAKESGNQTTAQEKAQTEASAAPAEEKKETEAQNASGGAKTELKWALWSADSQPYWRPIAEAYMEKHPDVSIELVDLGATDYSTALTTQLAGSNTPFDVVAIKDMASYLSFIGKGLLKPLDDSKLDLDVYGSTLDTLEWEGAHYTLPVRSDFYVLFYNKEVFDNAGVPYPTNDMTFEQYDAMVESLTDTSFGNEVYGTHYHTWNFCVQGMAAVGEGKNVMDGDYDYMKPYYEMVLKQQNEKQCMDYSTLKTSGLHYLGAFGQGNVGTHSDTSLYCT